MDSVLLSLYPKHCISISGGLKKFEIRKTRPKCDLPFKVYIYATKQRNRFKMSDYLYSYLDNLYLFHGKMSIGDAFEYFGETDSVTVLNGKVIGEFTCDSIDCFTKAFFDEQEPLDTDEISSLLSDSCLTYSQLRSYVGDSVFYAWHISDVLIYDSPKDLSDFIVPSRLGCVNEGKCLGCRFFDSGNGFNVEDDCYARFCTDEFKPLRRPPQSWCYVRLI